MKTVFKASYPVFYPPVTSLHLSDARLCVNCNVIHDQLNCPVCTSRSCIPLWDVLNRKPPVEEENAKGAIEPAVKLVVDDQRREEYSAEAVITAVA